MTGVCIWILFWIQILPETTYGSSDEVVNICLLKSKKGARNLGIFLNFRVWLIFLCSLFNAFFNRNVLVQGENSEDSVSGFTNLKYSGAVNGRINTDFWQESCPLFWIGCLTDFFDGQLYQLKRLCHQRDCAFVDMQWYIWAWISNTAGFRVFLRCFSNFIFQQETDHCF